MREMNHFNKIYKKKSKPQDTRRQKVRCSHYKGKEILSLISENKRLRQPPPQPHSQEPEDSDSEEQDSPFSNEAPPAVNMPSFLPVNIAFPYQTMPTMFFYSNPLPISTTFSLPSNQSLPLSEHCSFWPIACLPTTCETGEIKSDRLSAFSNPQS